MSMFGVASDTLYASAGRCLRSGRAASLLPECACTAWGKRARVHGGGIELRAGSPIALDLLLRPRQSRLRS